MHLFARAGRAAPRTRPARALSSAEPPMALSDLARTLSNKRPKIRVGRGIGSGKGKTAGRGHKGRRRGRAARAARVPGGQTPLHKALPKVGHF